MGTDACLQLPLSRRIIYYNHSLHHLTGNSTAGRDRIKYGDLGRSIIPETAPGTSRGYLREYVVAWPPKVEVSPRIVA
jgi:hypothetical protein